MNALSGNHPPFETLTAKAASPLIQRAGYRLLKQVNKRNDPSTSDGVLLTSRLVNSNSQLVCIKDKAKGFETSQTLKRSNRNSLMYRVLNGLMYVNIHPLKDFCVIADFLPKLSFEQNPQRKGVIS